MNYVKALPKGADKEAHEKAREIARPLTPKSEREVVGRIRPITFQTTQGLCTTGRKCVRQDGHAGTCWPL